MNITDKDGLFKLEAHNITNLKTNELRSVSGIPNGNAIAYMDYNLYIRNCSTAFHTGQWPASK